MATRDLGTLEQVPVREIWLHEENDFTPWLGDNLYLLGQCLELKLELLQVEAEMPDAGRVDILAKDMTSGATVVIENQLEYSDDDHFARLIGYAASRDAGILIWVTTGLLDRHSQMLDWLHMSYGVEVYGVEVSVWRIGDAVAHYFELIAGANASEGSAASSQLDNDEPAIGHRAYGRYYRPLTGNLNGKGIHAIGGRGGGWTGRFRSFRTGYEEDGIVYGLLIGDQDGKSWIWLRIPNDDHRTIYNALSEHRSEIDQEIVGHTLQWETYEEEGGSWVGMSTDATIDDAEEELEATRSWMFDGLIKLQMAVQPRLDEVMA